MQVTLHWSLQSILSCCIQKPKERCTGKMTVTLRWQLLSIQVLWYCSTFTSHVSFNLFYFQADMCMLAHLTTVQNTSSSDAVVICRMNDEHQTNSLEVKNKRHECCFEKADQKNPVFPTWSHSTPLCTNTTITTWFSTQKNGYCKIRAF